MEKIKLTRNQIETNKDCIISIDLSTSDLLCEDKSIHFCKLQDFANKLFILVSLAWLNIAPKDLLPPQTQGIINL